MPLRFMFFPFAAAPIVTYGACCLFACGCADDPSFPGVLFKAAPFTSDSGNGGKPLDSNDRKVTTEYTDTARVDRYPFASRSPPPSL